MSLTEEQREQLDLQFRENSKEKYTTNIRLSPEYTLKDFSVHPHVLNPEKVTALFLARWLFANPWLYKREQVIDMGCGSGIQGIVMGLQGAKSVDFSDKFEEPIENTRENIEKYNLSRISKIIQGDLFENIPGKSKRIVFNQPFFPGDPIDEFPVSRAMLDPGELIHKFLDQAPKHLLQEGSLIMPFYHPAGETNNPEIQGPKHNYSVTKKFSLDSKETLHKGKISIYELIPRNHLWQNQELLSSSTDEAHSSDT